MSQEDFNNFMLICIPNVGDFHTRNYFPFFFVTVGSLTRFFGLFKTSIKCQTGICDSPTLSMARLRVKIGFVNLKTICDLKLMSGMFCVKGWSSMDGKKDNLISDGWPVKVTNLPNGYLSWNLWTLEIQCLLLFSTLWCCLFVCR